MTRDTSSRIEVTSDKSDSLTKQTNDTCQDHRLNRRSVISAAGIAFVGLAGCSDDTGTGNGNGNSPEDNSENTDGNSNGNNTGDDPEDDTEDNQSARDLPDYITNAAPVFTDFAENWEKGILEVSLDLEAIDNPEQSTLTMTSPDFDEVIYQVDIEGQEIVQLPLGQWSDIRTNYNKFKRNLLWYYGQYQVELREGEVAGSEDPPTIDFNVNSDIKIANVAFAENTDPSVEKQSEIKFEDVDYGTPWVYIELTIRKENGPIGVIKRTDLEIDEWHVNNTTFPNPSLDKRADDGKTIEPKLRSNKDPLASESFPTIFTEDEIVVSYSLNRPYEDSIEEEGEDEFSCPPATGQLTVKTPETEHIFEFDTKAGEPEQHPPYSVICNETSLTVTNHTKNQIE